MEENNKFSLNNNTKLDINLKWLIQIITFTVTIAWGYFDITSQINELKINSIRNDENIKLNSEFRIKWPLGQLGSLPDDAEQNLRLKYIEKEIEKLLVLTEELKTKSIKQEMMNNKKAGD